MKRSLRVLLIEDNHSDAELALYELKKAGFDCTGRAVTTRAAMIRELETLDPEIILSDFTLPKFDGISALQVAQARRPNVPFIFVSGTLGEDRAIETLENGAADYILKTNLKRLGTAVRRALKDASEHAARNELESQLLYLAQHDPLTGLPNRSQFRERVNGALARAIRSKQQVGLLLLDLDRFQAVNNKLGHHAADEVLKEVAHRIKKAARDGDTVARVGGDEFAVVLEGTIERDGVSSLAQGQLEGLSLPIRREAGDIRLTASIGLSVFPQDAQDSDGLLRSADVAMLHAKERGRNNYQFYSADLDALSRREEFRRAEIQQRLLRLTRRESEVLDLLTAGKSSKVIAYLLGASTRTIDVHRARVMEKMEAESVADLVRMVVEHRT